MLHQGPERELADLAVLAEPVRRRLYLYVSGRPEPVSRDEAAAAAGITRSLAAFHLDRLVAAGLLATEYRRLGGRSGPGAGRPSKLYRASGQEVSTSVPARRYEVAAELLAEAITAPQGHGLEMLDSVAHRYGQQLGREALRRAGPRAGEARRLAALEGVLADAGYVPFRSGADLRMLNCPFHELAQHHRAMTCGMNLALLQGLLEGARLPQEMARPDPQPGMCCVAISSVKPIPD